MSEYLMSQLPEFDLKQLVQLKLEGHTNEDIAELMQITRRTVQRKLERIRRIWLESAELPKPTEKGSLECHPFGENGDSITGGRDDAPVSH